MKNSAVVKSGRVLEMPLHLSPLHSSQDNSCTTLAWLLCCWAIERQEPRSATQARTVIGFAKSEIKQLIHSHLSIIIISLLVSPLLGHGSSLRITHKENGL
jgi:hypothetical protein